MNDYISRAKAIEYFMINTNWHDEDGYSIDDWDEKRKLLEDYFNGVPPEDVQPVVQWIPCSERLPDRQGRYLVWAVMSFVPDHVDDPNTYQGTTIASYFERLTPFKWLGDNVEHVIAWMPLPEPYLEGADNVD